MVLISFLLAFFLAIFRDTFKYSLLPIFFAVLIKGPCKGSLSDLGGDDLAYQNAIINGFGLSDQVFNKFYHHIYLLTNSLDFTYLAMAIMLLLLSIFALFVDKKLLSYPYRFNFLFPVLAILPMILTGAIRQNFGYLLSLLILTVYISTFFAKPKYFYSLILPSALIFTSLGHFATVLFTCLLIFVYHFVFSKIFANNVVKYKPILSYAHRFSFPSPFLSFTIRKSAVFSLLLISLLVLAIYSYITVSFSSPTSLSFVQSYFPNLYLNFSSSDITYNGLTLFKKSTVILIVLILAYCFQNNNSSKASVRLLLSLLDYFLIVSFFIMILGYFMPSTIFPKLMRLSTFLELSSLYIASDFVPRSFLLTLTCALFISGYFASLARPDYLIFLKLPFIDALSYCTF